MNFKPKPSNNNAALLVLAVICDLQSETSSGGEGEEEGYLDYDTRTAL